MFSAFGVDHGGEEVAKASFKPLTNAYHSAMAGHGQRTQMKGHKVMANMRPSQKAIDPKYSKAVKREEKGFQLKDKHMKRMR